MIGKLARRLTDPVEQALYSRSARDLLHLATRFPEAVVRAAKSGARSTRLMSGVKHWKPRLIRNADF